MAGNPRVIWKAAAAPRPCRCARRRCRRAIAWSNTRRRSPFRRGRSAAGSPRLAGRTRTRRREVASPPSARRARLQLRSSISAARWTSSVLRSTAGPSALPRPRRQTSWLLVSTRSSANQGGGVRPVDAAASTMVAPNASAPARAGDFLLHHLGRRDTASVPWNARSAAACW